MEIIANRKFSDAGQLANEILSGMPVPPGQVMYIEDEAGNYLTRYEVRMDMLSDKSHTYTLVLRRQRECER